MLTLNGMFTEPKPHRINFIKENKKKLKEISSMVNQNSKSSKVDGSKSQCFHIDAAKTAHHSPSKHRPNRKLSATECKVSACKGTMTVYLQKKEKANESSTDIIQKPSQKNLIAAKNQSSQTIDPKKYDQLFHEGTIKYPSNKIVQELEEIKKQKQNRLNAHIKKEFLKKNKLRHKSSSITPLKQHNPKEAGKGDTKESISSDNNNNKKNSNTKTNEDTENSNTKTNEDTENSNTEVEIPSGESVIATSPTVPKQSHQTVINAADIIRKTTEDHIQYSPRGTTTQRSSGGYTSDRAPNNHGDSNSVPPSAKPNKKQITKRGKKEDEALKTVSDPMCPPGHIPLPDQERKKTLHMLRVSYAELVREMNLLPVRTDTLRVRQKKIQLENQLNKIEEGIKVFSKSKVYVKIEE